MFQEAWAEAINPLIPIIPEVSPVLHSIVQQVSPSTDQIRGRGMKLHFSMRGIGKIVQPSLIYDNCRKFKKKN